MASLSFQCASLIVVLTSAVGECSFDPLILSPLVNSGRIKEAQEAARVVPDMNGEKSYSGFFTVNEKCGSNLFFWFFTAKTGWENAPVLLWLNGGPGSSSLLGMFEEVGPFNYERGKKKFVKNKYSWTNTNNVIFLDQPVGTGFSFTTGGCYGDNMTAIAQDVYSFLPQFFRLFPNLVKNSFFITGESFGGHYIPAIAYEIHRRNPRASPKINLVGCVIGNADVDVRCEKFAQYMYEAGIIDEKTRKKMTFLEDSLEKAIDAKNYTMAFDEDGKRFEIIHDVTVALPSVYNVLYDKETDNFYQLLIRRYDVRKQLHVGNLSYSLDSDAAYAHLELAMYVDAMSFIEKLLESKQYVIGFYSGLLDLRVPYTSTECFLRRLRWDGSQAYLSANRTTWYVGERLAGWFKVAGNLFEMAVRGAGHLVPTDQPEASLALITAAISSKPGQPPLSTLSTEAHQ